MRRTPREIVIWLASLAGILLGALAALFLLIATGLALVPSPKLTYAARTLNVKAGPCRDVAGVRCFRMRDGARIAARTLPLPASANGGPIVVLLHGILSTGAELETTARDLQATAGARVIRLDLRGHGLSASGPAETPGDLAHIGQWEEDAADVVAALRRESPGVPIVLGGHSMGGGIALRYALRRKTARDVPDVDGYLLFAPHLGDSSPTARHEPAASGNTGARSAPPPILVNVPRIIGLAFLNLAGIRGLNGLPVLAFDLPFPLPFRSYTFRAIASSAPEKYRDALTADAKPLLVVAGEKDEAFHAEEYPGVVALHRNGKTVIVPGASHDGVLRDPAALAAAREWIKASYGAKDSSAAASSATPRRIS